MRDVYSALFCLEIAGLHFGTVFRPSCIVLTLNWVNSNNCSRRTSLVLLILIRQHPRTLDYTSNVPCIY